MVTDEEAILQLMFWNVTQQTNTKLNQTNICSLQINLVTHLFQWKQLQFSSLLYAMCIFIINRLNFAQPPPKKKT